MNHKITHAGRELRSSPDPAPQSLKEGLRFASSDQWCHWYYIDLILQTLPGVTVSSWQPLIQSGMHIQPHCDTAWPLVKTTAHLGGSLDKWLQDLKTNIFWREIFRFEVNSRPRKIVVALVTLQINAVHEKLPTMYKTLHISISYTNSLLNLIKSTMS